MSPRLAMERRYSIQGSNTDFLLRVAAGRRKMSIYTTDRDFERYAETLDGRAT